MAKILIIEDERPMAEAIGYSLSKEGFRCDIVTEGESGWLRAYHGEYDLVILDLMLPGMDGLDILKNIRREGELPVLILTAKDTDLDKILGLELGADDYMTKPFNTREMVARIKTILRRATADDSRKHPSALEAGGVRMETESHLVEVRGRRVDLPPIEFRLLELFLKNEGRALAREYLLRAGWEGEFYGQSKTLDVHINRLREKIEADPSAPRLIVTVRGIGYRFEPNP